jgi:hypothetical protein
MGNQACHVKGLRAPARTADILMLRLSPQAPGDTLIRILRLRALTAAESSRTTSVERYVTQPEPSIEPHVYACV